jgi:hypothetical protein
MPRQRRGAHGERGADEHRGRVDVDREAARGGRPGQAVARPARPRPERHRHRVGPVALELQLGADRHDRPGRPRLADAVRGRVVRLGGLSVGDARDRQRRALELVGHSRRLQPVADLVAAEVVQLRRRGQRDPIARLLVGDVGALQPHEELGRRERARRRGARQARQQAQRERAPRRHGASSASTSAARSSRRGPAAASSARRTTSRARTVAPSGALRTSAAASASGVSGRSRRASVTPSV